MRRGDDAVGHGGLEVGGQQEGIAHGEDPIAGAELVAVAQFGVGEIVAAEELDQGHVAGRIEADDHGVVDAAVGQAALHGVAAGLGDVEIGQGVAVGGDEHAGAAPLPVRARRSPPPPALALAMTAIRCDSAWSTAAGGCDRRRRGRFAAAARPKSRPPKTKTAKQRRFPRRSPLPPGEG